MFWNKKKPAETKSKKTIDDDRLVDGKLVLKPTDDDLKRAEMIWRTAGVHINDTVRGTIFPWMARAIRTYQELDRAAWERELKEKEKKSEQHISGE